MPTPSIQRTCPLPSPSQTLVLRILRRTNLANEKTVAWHQCSLLQFLSVTSSNQNWLSVSFLYIFFSLAPIFSCLSAYYSLMTIFITQIFTIIYYSFYVSALVFIILFWINFKNFSSFFFVCSKSLSFKKSGR